MPKTTPRVKTTAKSRSDELKSDSFLHERGKVKLLQRLRRLRGQLDAVERALNAEEDCGGQLMLLAAVRGAVNGLMGEVLENHIRFHLTLGSKEQIAPELAEDLIDLVHAYLK
jgi:DNA-binding FrmR family transcriptional regulator